jgi:16S rRNA (cytosine967-C5)-methyltransferase
MKVRELAFEIISTFYKKKTFINIALSQAIRRHNLTAVDRAFLTRLVYGTLQNHRLLDYEIKKVTTNKKIRPDMRSLLKCALYQMRFMDKVPAYAIINESVEIAKKNFGLQATSFCNAVLRQLQKEKFEPKREEFIDELAYLSLVYSHPEWLLRMVAKHHGQDSAICWLKNNNKEAPLTVRVNTLKAKKEELLKLGFFRENLASSEALDYIDKGNPADLPEFLAGKFVIQDLSSQLVASLLNPKVGDTVLDMCAAPGSKTYHLAALMKNQGKIVALDIHEHRLKLLVGNLPRLGISIVETKQCDATKLDQFFPAESFDAVLLDAPCSGLGVIRRKPDILINLKQEALDSLIDTQRLLIDQAVKVVKKGGTLVYSTCTINKKENEGQIEYLLKRYPNFKLESQTLILDNENLNDDFFMAKLRRSDG